jgi:dTDP-4-dehydrorhamnose 3,5-epimerase-like enzyme
MFEVLNLNKFTDGKGDLIPIELGIQFEKSNIPFDVKRIYFISNLDNDVVRGKHSHKNLQQVIICAQGSFTLELENINGIKKSITLDKNNIGIYIKHGLVWRELKNFSNNCVVIILADNHYKESDYIRNYSEFKKLIIKK